MLDEPTNHLDTESAEKLTDSLAGYDGTLLFVSHNLDFARRLANVVWEVSSAGVAPYPGSLDDYLDHLAAQEDAADRALLPSSAPEAAPSDKAARIAARKVKKEREAEVRRRRTERERASQRLEEEIAELEAALAALRAELEDPATHEDHARSRRLSGRYAELESKLGERMEEWVSIEELSE